MNYVVFDSQLIQMSNYIKLLLEPDCGIVSQYSCVVQITQDNCDSTSSTVLNKQTGESSLFSNYWNEIWEEGYTKSCSQCFQGLLKCQNNQIYSKFYIPWTNDMIYDCSMTYELLDQVTQISPDSSVFAVTNMNQIQISVSRATIPKIYTIVVTAYAHSTVSSFETIIVQITDLCPQSQIMPMPMSEQIYQIGDLVKTIQLTPWTTSITFCNDITYEATLNGSTVLTSFATFFPSSYQFKVQTNSLTDIGQYEFKIKGKLENGNSAQISLLLSIIVSCTQNIVSIQDFGIAPNIIYNITQGEAILTFNEFSDLSNQRCGQMIYSATYDYGLNFPYMVNMVKFDSAKRQFTIDISDTNLNNTSISIKVEAQIGTKTAQKIFQLSFQYLCYVKAMVPFIDQGVNMYKKDLVKYRIGSGKMIISFDEFVKYQNCVYPIIYTLSITGQNSNPNFLSSQNISQRQIITSDDKTYALNPDYVLKVTGTISNINDTRSENLYIPLKLIQINNSPPTFQQPLTNILIKVDDQLQYVFPDIIDIDGDNFQIESIDLGVAQNFIDDSFPNFLIKPFSPFIGTFKIKIKIKDDNPNPLTKTYSLLIQVYDNPVKPSSANQNSEPTTISSTNTSLEYQFSNNESMSYSVRSDLDLKLKKKGKVLSASIQKISINGLVKIQFNQKIKVPSKFEQFDKRVLNLKISDINEDKNEDIKFNWKIVQFQQSYFQIQINFDDPKQISSKVIEMYCNKNLD
ncbi:cadg domain containing protein [Stylonychia lemnae]|uniref:Cadg domain containing protein n=1 Tax=Stylonychia lemnae TaxID=5949 RepID=A0A078AW48_STYLE|nr:cadg domain containing protein [Stylonychia lemnae]|eukprot:CDW86695.1 cadg domain containing protein [Stylonychia lemnae]